MAEVLETGLPRLLERQGLPSHQWKALRAIMACRTGRLGGEHFCCSHCGREHFRPHSCRNRHCPLCQGERALQWLDRQEQALLPVPYFHLVFTLPHQLNSLIRQNQRILYDLLFASASSTLLDFGQKRFGGSIGITAVLHTWSQNLSDHYHLHCIVSGGAWDGQHWVDSSRRFLFPVHALSQVFRARFCEALVDQIPHLSAQGQLLGCNLKTLATQVRGLQWVVYAKAPFAGPAQVLAYLSRYTHRVAISPRRLLSLSHEQVRFSWKDYTDQARWKTMELEPGEFVRRFCLHLLPPRFVKIRHYGFMGNRGRGQRLDKIKAAFTRTVLQPQPTKTKSLPSTDVLPICPFCGERTLHLVARTHAAFPQPKILDST